MTSKLNINWLNKCRCGNRMHTVETVRGSHVRLFEDDAVKCNSCGREGVIQTCDGIATVLWETDAERAEGEAITKLTREENVQAVFDLKAGYTLGLADVEILKRVARMALAAMDSEPSRNPVLAYADSYRDMAKQGVESVPIWSVITDLERNIAPLYRHAQPAPVVLDDGRADFEAWVQGVHGGDISKAQLPDGEDYANAHTRCVWKSWSACRAAMLQAGNSPVIPDGWTGNDKANAALMMLDRIETVDPVDDDRIDGIKRIVRELAAGPQEVK